tara:strand:- start:708 stop:1103 length:396 start_codon:yes stop_codon:yes gene_type:complete
MEVDKIIDIFFRQDKEVLQDSISNVLSEKDSAELLKIKDAFESEKNVRGGCSACRLRALTGKYKPIASALLNDINLNYAKAKAEKKGLTVTKDGKFLNQDGEEVNEKGETKRQNRRRRARESRERRRRQKE